MGLLALLLAGLLRLQAAGDQVRDRTPLLVFGQTALFFYLIHVHLMVGWRAIFHAGVFGPGAPYGLAGAWLWALAVLVVTHPLCLRYRELKRARPRSFLRF